MTTTNKAFIDAYRSGSPRPTVRAMSTDALLSEAFFGTSEMVSTNTIESGSDRDAPRELAIDDTPAQAGAFRLPPKPSNTTTRRPLSELRAEDLIPKVQSREAQPPVASFGQPQWPEVCQQLLSVATDQYDAVLRNFPSAGTGQLIGIVGTGPETGCTTTAICLALRCAALGYSTVLVDGNFAAPSMARLLDLRGYTGWDQLLVSSLAVTTAIKPAEDVGIDLLLAGPAPIKKLETTARFRTSLAAGALRRNYERVIIDLGNPAGAAANVAAELASTMGVDFLVAAASPNTSQADTAETVTALARYNLRLAGTIEAAC